MSTPAVKPLTDLERTQQSYASGSQTYRPTPSSQKPVGANCASERLPSLSRS
jgi:hypothetical protein